MFNMSPLLKHKNRIIDEKFLLRKYCLLSAAFAFGIMMIMYLFHGNSLWLGDHTVLRIDLYHQYGPLYAEVYDRITQGDSLIYSWTSGLGGSFLGNLFNYCSSPFALIMLLFGHKNMPEAIAVMILGKAMLAAAGFTYYINKTNGHVRKESIIFGQMYAFSAYFVAYSWNIMWLDAFAVFPLVMLGIERIIQKNKPGLYIAAMTYTMITNYYMAFMVCIFSVLYFLYYYFGRYELTSSIFRKKEEAALIFENIHESVHNDSDDAVILPDSVSEIPDNYIQEAVTDNTTDESLFVESISEDSAVTPVAETEAKINKERNYLLKHRRFWVTGWTFALSSFLCFALAAFALIPVYFCLQSSSATAGTFPEESKQYFDIFTFVANHLPAVEPTIRSSGDNVIPNVYCGLLTVILLPFYFLSDRIPGKQKIVSAILMMGCFLGFVFNYFNFIWHGLHMPNDLPYRWSFAYSFLLLTLAYKAFIHIGEFSKKSYIGTGFAVLIFVVFVEKFGVENCDELTLLATVIFTMMYVAILSMMKSSKYRKSALVFLLFFAVIFEIFVSDAPKFVMEQRKSAYTGDYINYKDLSEKVEAADEELFFRTELAKLRARMDPSWYGYNGTSTFSSMAYEHTAKTMKKLGFFANNINSYTYYPQTAIFNSMFSIKYIYDNMNFLQNDNIYTLVDKNDDFEAFKYKYFLPPLFSIDEAVLEWDYASNDPFVVQNNLMTTATGVSDILIPVEATDVNTENLNDVSLSSINSGVNFSVSKASNGSEAKAYVKIKPDVEGNYYVYAGSTRLSAMKITAADLSYNYVSSSIQPFILDLGYLTPEDEVVVTYTIPASNNTATIAFCAARLDVEKFEEAYNKILSNGTIDLTSFDETSLTGTINVKNDNAFIWTSIPYDESWEIFVDGQLLDYTVMDDDTDEIIKEGSIDKVGGGLIGFDIDEGEHSIEMKYKAKGLSTGIKFTVTGIIILALIIFYKKWLVKILFKKGGFIPVFLREPDYEN